MFAFIKRQKGKFLFSAVSRLLVFVLSFSLVLGPSAAQAQTIASLNLPVPGAMVGPSAAFVPVLLKGMTVHPDNPLQFDFIIDSGNTNFKEDQIKNESQRLVKYFLASMTIPKDDLWVNLSPYESDRIIPKELGKTELGRDMLAQDYILKQLTASLMYPEKELGKEFWEKVYRQAKEKYGTTEIPVDTFNKVWILPETATVYEHGQTVYIVEARLKVMLDSDYLAMGHNVTTSSGHKTNTGDTVTGDLVTPQIVREIILPAIEKEVNEGQNFAPLRQIYHSLILAKWYKETIKNSLLSKIYVDQKKIAGVNLDDATLKDQIYARYMEAYKKGVFNYIKEDYNRLSNETIPRKYFSGGEMFTNFELIALNKTSNPARVTSAKVGQQSLLTTRVNPQKGGKILPKGSSSPISPEEAKFMIKEKLIPEYHHLIKGEDIQRVIEYRGKFNVVIKGTGKEIPFEDSTGGREVSRVWEDGYYEYWDVVSGAMGPNFTQARYDLAIEITPDQSSSPINPQDAENENNLVPLKAIEKRTTDSLQARESRYEIRTKSLISRFKKYLSLNWQKRLLNSSPEEAAHLIEQLLSEKKATAKEIVQALSKFYDLLGTLNDRDQAIKKIVEHIQWTPALAQLLDEFELPEIDQTYWGYAFNPSLVRDILLNQAALSPSRFNELFNELSPALQNIAEIVLDPAGAFWKRTGLPLFNRMVQLGQGIETTKFYVGSEWFYLDKTLRYKLKFDIEKTDGSYRVLEIDPMTRKITLRKGFEYEPDGIFDKKDITFFTKGDAGYDALVQEMTDISKIISAEHEEPIVQQQLAAVIDWLQNDQKLVAAQGGVPAWVREGYKGKPAKFGQVPPVSQEVKVTKLSQQRQHELADFKEKLWSDNPGNAAQKINEQIADGNLDYKDVLWLLNDNQLGDSQTWEWAAAVILRLTPKEFVWELLEHFSEGYFGPQVRTPMLMSVMTEVDAQRAAHLLANTKFLQWALRLEEQYFGMSLNNSRALIRALYQERAMTSQELAGLFIYLIRLGQDKVEGHSLYTIKEAAANQLTLLKSILDEMQPQDAAVIMDAFRKEFGQSINLKEIADSSSPVSDSDQEPVGGIDMNAIDLEREGAGVDIQFNPAQLQEIIDAGIDGFAPVIINITPLPSVLPLLGLEPQRKEEELEVSSLN